LLSPLVVACSGRLSESMQLRRSTVLKSLVSHAILLDQPLDVIQDLLANHEHEFVWFNQTPPVVASFVLIH
jgi:hypothetical protein